MEQATSLSLSKALKEEERLLSEHLAQLRLFGAEEMPADDLVSAYLHLQGKKHLEALEFILQRRDYPEILIKIIQKLFYWLTLEEHSRNKKSVVMRQRELLAILESLQDPLLDMCLQFCQESATRERKRMRQGKQG